MTREDLPYPVADSHCHVGLEWFEPVETLLHCMDSVGVGSAVLTLPVFATDDSYQQECVLRYPGRFANVVSIPSSAADPAGRARALIERGVSGLRIRVSDRYATDPLEIWRAADRGAMTVTCLAGEADLACEDFVSIVRSFPNVRIVLEHLGSTNHPTWTTPEERRPVFELARYPHVFMKIHGVAEFASSRLDPFHDPPFVEPVPPFLEWAVESFTPRRLLWGSDFPNVCAREGYGNSLRYTRRQLSTLSADELAMIFGGNARTLFGLRN